MSYPSGATDVPPPSGCGSCECRDGAPSCSEEACTTGLPITPCGQSITSDPFALTRTLLVGDRLTVQMQHPGDCTLASVEVGLCGDAAANCEAPAEACPSLDVDCVGGRCTAAP